MYGGESSDGARDIGKSKNYHAFIILIFENTLFMQMVKSLTSRMKLQLILKMLSPIFPPKLIIFHQIKILFPLTHQNENGENLKRMSFGNILKRSNSLTTFGYRSNANGV
jgi:hypothetical protein